MQKIKAVLSNSSDSSHQSHHDSTTGTTSSPTRAASQSIPGTHNSGSGLTGSHSGSGLTGSHSGTGMHNTSAGGAAGNQLPVREGVTGRHEETAGHDSRQVSGKTGPFTDPHSLGHDHSISNNFDLKSASHEHTHLGAKTHEHRHEHEVEEVARVKDHERHVHHVQHHVQPVHDRQVLEEQHHHRAIPQTKIHEKHGSSKEDIAAFSNLAIHKDEHHHHGKDRQVVDLGETVNETVHHHVHNVVQPIVEREVHEHHKIHTVIPTHHVTHEAPIIHESIAHKPLSIDAFKAQGGNLTSGVSHHEAGVLTQGGCDRSIEGVGEDLAKELNLKHGTTSNQHRGDTRI